MLSRLVPQVSDVLVNANRSLPRYQRLGWPVLHDADPAAYDGPLAGMLAFTSTSETCGTSRDNTWVISGTPW
ncbi:MAG: hypothetical protein AAF460_08640 [Pseudomonadota bacterium]